MAQIPLLSGIVAGPAAEFIETYPLNLEPTAVDAKIAGKGQFKAPPGTVQTGTGNGADRGGVLWERQHIRVLGTELCEIGPDGSRTVLASIPGTERCRFAYSFDRLGIATETKLYYYSASEGLTQVIDFDLGAVVDLEWIDGYFMSTDGTYVVVTELSDPMEVQPLKYGSAEEDPDAITGLLKYRGEAYVFGRYTIQTFRNVGGNGFPFQTVRNSTIPFGCVNPRAKTLFGDGFAFVGSSKEGELNVYVGGQGNATAFGNKGLCEALNRTDEGLIEVENRDYGNEQRLLIHLPDESWCFLVGVSKAVGQPVWYRLQSDGGSYRIRNMTLAHGKRWVGDSQSGAYGYLEDGRWDHWGDEPEWQFEAGKLYNNGQPFTVHSAELIGLPGRGSGTGSIFMSMTRDGETWSTERAITVKLGERTKRLQWRPHARFTNYMGFRFRGRGAALPGIAALEVQVG